MCAGVGDIGDDCMLYVISGQRVAWDLYRITPGPLEDVCWRQLTAQLGDCKNLELRLSVL